MYSLGFIVHIYDGSVFLTNVKYQIDIASHDTFWYKTVSYKIKSISILA